MKLKPREIAFIAGGVLIVLLGWVARAKPWSALGPGGGQAGTLLARVDQYGQLRQGVAQSAVRLGMKIPRAGLPDQESAMRRELGKLAQSNGMELGSLTRIDVGGVRGTVAAPIVDFQFDVKGRFDGLVKFVHALETGKMPFSILEFRVMPGSGGGGKSRGSSGGGSRDGRVQATIKARGYLFPRVFEDKNASKDADKPEPPRPSRPDAGPEGPMPPTMNGPSGPTPTPTPTAASGKPTPKASSGTPHKITIRAQGMEIVIDMDNRTMTMNGETKPMSDKEYQEAVEKLKNDDWRKELPPDAEVTVE